MYLGQKYEEEEHKRKWNKHISNGDFITSNLIWKYFAKKGRKNVGLLSCIIISLFDPLFQPV